MTRDTVRARQANEPDPGARLIRVTVTAIQDSTVTVLLPGGSTITAPKVAGVFYTVDALAFAIGQEPAIGSVLPTGAAPQPLGADVVPVTVNNGTFTNLTYNPISSRPELTTSGYRAPRDGWYQAHGFVRWADNPASNRGLGLGITVNGNRFDNRIAWTFFSTTNPGGSARLSQETSQLIRCNRNEVIGLVLYSDGGNTAVASGTLEITAIY